MTADPSQIELEEIAGAINSHPEVLESAVVVREDVPGDRRLAAYVVIGAGDENRITKTWHSQWDGMHSQGIEAAEAAGSSESPMSALLRGMQLEDHETQVREFEEQTLARIRALHPRRVLEIGGGTGNLALPLAPECERYVVTDFSPPALDYLRARVPGNVTVLERDAADLHGIEAGAFDTVLLHSVCQYFPSSAYLCGVIEGLVRATAPGGRIYVGDVQSFALLEALHRGKQARRAPESLPVAELAERIRRTVAREVELVADPGFFYALRAQLPAVSRVECQLRRGHVLNEAVKFHYDVVLHVGAAAEPLAPARWLDWREDRMDLPALRGELEVSAPEVLGIRLVPNSRVRWEVAALAEMQAPAPPATVGELRARVAHAVAREPGIDPEDLWDLAEATGYAAAINWSSDAAGADGALDVIFYRKAGVPVFPLPADAAGKPPGAFANQPGQAAGGGDREASGGQVDEVLAARMRSYLKDKLPEPLIPAVFVPLSRLPLNPEGKVDPAALPAPDFSRIAAARSERTAPATALEKFLVALWCEILGIEGIGTHDHFFEFGGDSLTGMRMVNRLRESLGVPVSLAVVFEAPTIQELARLLESQHPSAVGRLCGPGPDAAAAPRASAAIMATPRETRRVKRSTFAGG